DIDTVVAGFSGHGTADQGAIVLVRGKFDQGKIEDLAKQHGGTISDYHGKKIITVANDGPKSDAMKSGSMGQGVSAMADDGVVAFIQPGLLAFGETATVHRAIDAGASGDNITKNAALMKYVKGVQNGNDAWVVGRFDEVTKSASLPQD